MSPLAALLIGTIFVSSGLALGVSAILQEQKQRRQFSDRLQLVASTYMKVNPLSEMGRAARTGQGSWLIAILARLFGYDPAHAEHYLFRWWIVVGTALVPARAVAELVGIYAGSWSLLVVPVAWVFFCRFVFNWSEERRRNILYTQFPDALAMIVRAVRVGIPLGEGVHTVAREALPPTGQEFALLYDRISIGVTLEDALHEMADRTGIPEYRFFATALALQGRTGGGLSEALDGLAEVMRRRLALKARGLALAAEAKTSIAILAALPFVAGGALGVLNPHYIGRLFNEHGCQKVLLLAVALFTGGLVVMRTMIRKALA